MGSQSAADLVNLLKIYWSLLLGNIVEWYEYAIYGHLVLSLEKHFFRGSAIGVWLGFGVTFLARPLGGLVLGVIGDRWGRRVAVNISIVGMLIGTVGQGCLPVGGPDSLWISDVSMVLLAILRFVQGLSAAGEIVTITSYLTEVCSHRMMCRGIALIAVTVNLGFLAAKAVAFTTEAVFGAEAVDQWAWRIPFIIAIFPGMVAVIGRRRLPESNMYLEAQKAQAESTKEGTVISKVKAAVSGHWPSMLIGMCGVCAFAVLQYSCFVWTQSFLAAHKMAPGDRMWVGLIARMLQTVLALPLGYIADLVGVGTIMLVGPLATVIAAVPLWSIILHNPTSLVAVGWAFGVGCGTLGLLVATLPYFFVVELFPTDVRNTAVGISYNLGFAIFGGLSPVMAEVLLSASPMGPGFLWMAGGLVTFLSVIVAIHCQRNGMISMTHVRKTPYFGTSTFADDKTGKLNKKDSYANPQSSESDSSTSEYTSTDSTSMA